MVLSGLEQHRKPAVAGLDGPSGLARLRAFAALLKLRPMSVVLFTAAVGLIAAPEKPDLATCLVALMAIAIGGCGSAVLNMWWERDIDRIMVRTAHRPLPAGRVSPGEALTIALVMIGGGVGLMAAFVNPVAAVLLAATIAAYGVVYTMWLKRTSVLNVVVGGGLASLLTPLAGWSAATGSVGIEALALFAFLVPWTPPHVWSQALVRLEDYERAGVPMLPAVAGKPATRRLIAVLTVVHSLMALLPLAIGAAGVMWAVVAVVGGAALSVDAIRLARLEAEVGAKRREWAFYRRSILYLVALFAALIVERGLGLMVPLDALSGAAAWGIEG